MKVSLSGTGVLALAGVAGLILLYWKRGAIVGAAAGAAQDIAWAATPWNPENVFYGSVNAVGGALVTDPAGPGKNADGSWTLGGWVHDVLNPDTAQAVRDVGQVSTYPSTAVWEAEWNDARRVFAATDPRRVDIPATSDYGAAFGIYPRP